MHTRKVSVYKKSALSRLLAIVIAVIVIAAVIAAVYVATRPHAPTVSAPVKITFAGWVSSGEEYLFDVQMADEFNSLNPGIVVNFTPITSNYYSTLATELSTGTGPSVFYMENTELPRFAAAGYLLNLTPYLQSDPSFNLSDFIPSIIKTFYYHGQLYAVPKDWNVLAVFYNKQLLSMAGLPPPPQNWNWSTFVYYLKTLKAKLPAGYYPMVLGPQWARILAFVHEAGGDWVNAQGTGTPSNTTPIYVALSFWYGLYQQGLATLNTNLAAGWNGGDFALGKVAMVVSGGWTIPVLESNSSKVPAGDWGVQWMPSDVQRGTMLFTVGLAVNSHLTPAQTQAAVKFVEFFTGEQGQFQWVMKGLALPTRLSILHNTTYVDAQPQLAYMAEQYPFAYGWAYNTVNWDAMHTLVHDTVANLFSGTITLQQAYQQIVMETNESLKGS
jgi:ABC-type glycerol-3-phosphate transport system substrate-binding protein